MGVHLTNPSYLPPAANTIVLLFLDLVLVILVPTYWNMIPSKYLKCGTNPKWRYTFKGKNAWNSIVCGNYLWCMHNDNVRLTGSLIPNNFKYDTTVSISCHAWTVDDPSACVCVMSQHSIVSCITYSWSVTEQWL